MYLFRYSLLRILRRNYFISFCKVMLRSYFNTSRRCISIQNFLLVKRTLKRHLPPDPSLADNVPVYEFQKKKKPSKNILYVWGLGEHGALGHYLQKKKVMKGKTDLRFRAFNRPLRMSFGEINSVTHVAAGFGFSLFALKRKDNLKVFGSGLNSDSQLGYQTAKGNRSLGILLSPVPIKIPFKNSKDTKITGVSAGRAHSVVVTDNDGVYTFGNNAYGQCGRNIVEMEEYKNSNIIHHIKTLDGLKIISAECGQDHTFFLMEDGSIYSCGWNADGQTGLGNGMNQSKPERVKGDIEGEKIVKISSKSDCVLALNDKGEVFGWGNSEYCQLFSEDNELQNCSIPMQLKKCNGYGKIVDVAAAGSLCMMLNEAGEVFTWGFGILGRGPEATHSWQPEIIPPTLFGNNQFFRDTKVDKIYCGLNHCAAINSNGAIYTWGKNRGYCLGLGIKHDQFFPLRVSVCARGKELALGADHTLALCGTF